MADDADLIVIGAGMAGINAAGRAAEADARVVVIERDRVGGTCPLRGCIPTPQQLPRRRSTQRLDQVQPRAAPHFAALHARRSATQRRSAGRTAATR